MDRRAERIGSQRRQKHLERREQLASQIAEGEQLVSDFRAELASLQAAADAERAGIEELRRTAVHTNVEIQAQVGTQHL